MVSFIGLILQIYALSIGLNETEVGVDVENLRNAYVKGLNRHNLYRRRHHAPNLVLDRNICAIAQNYADYLARTGKFEHSGAKGLGENLFMMWFGKSQDYEEVADRIESMAEKATDSWYSEVRYYDYNRAQFSMKTGHFTQVVWKNTRRVGFGIGRNGGKYVVVANYAPPGNYAGQFSQNVLRP